MEFVAVLAAAIAAYAFGAVWYMAMAKPWMAAAGLTEEQVNNAGKSAYVIAFVAVILVAGMMRHMFGMAGIDTAAKGVTAGLGIGLFIVVPWVATHYAFGLRPMRLTVIDGVYSVVGSAIIGAVLTLL